MPLYPIGYTVIAATTGDDGAGMARARLSGTFLSAAAPAVRRPAIVAALPPELVCTFMPDAPSSAQRPERRRLWELDLPLHCSILGTCFSPGELRAVAGRILPALRDRQAWSDHDVHREAVRLAAQPDKAGRMLSKALDTRFAGKIRQFAGSSTVASLLALWQAHLEEGDVPGAYWAALTHPLLDEDTRTRIFGDVHMLSHLVGASNRADIRRLRALEHENARLLAETDRLRRLAREATAGSDRLAHEVAALEATLAAARRRPAEPAPGKRAVADALAVALSRAEELAATAAAQAGELAAAREEAARLASELAAREREVQALEQGAARRPEGAPLELGGRTVLVVGGRLGQVPHLRGFIEARGGTLLHHDAGMEQSCASIPALVGRADIVLVPTTCTSHEAALAAKRAAQQAGRPFLPLARFGLGAVAAALEAWLRQDAA